MRFSIGWMLGTVGMLGCDAPPLEVAGSARILNGATPGAAVARDRTTASTAALPLVEGPWVISPDQVEVRLLSIQFFRSSRDYAEVDLGPDCLVTYDKAAPTLSTRLNCPFGLEPGTYGRMDLKFGPAFKVLIDDQVHGLFTDPASPTSLSSTRPAGGAQLVDFVVTPQPGSDGWNASTMFTTPLVVTEDEPVEVDVVLHGLHTMTLEVTNGAPAFYTETSRRPWPVKLYPSVNGVSTSEYYTSVGTADSYALREASTPVQALIFYETPSVPALAWFELTAQGCGQGIPHAENASPDQPYVTGPNGERAGGYLGLDASTLCWAQGRDEAYSAYTSLVALTRITNEGATGVLACQPATTAPPPTTGTTYSAGCPVLVAPRQIDVTLVAN